MPAVNDVSEPCAEQSHARFDGRELETAQSAPWTRTERHGGKPLGHSGSATYRHELAPRQLPTLRGRGTIRPDTVHVADCIPRAVGSEGVADTVVVGERGGEIMRAGRRAPAARSPGHDTVLSTYGKLSPAARRPCGPE
jgi:hypothetical protein